MSAYPYEEHTRVAVVPSIHNLAAPTMAELAAGIDITCDLARDGLNLPRNTEKIPRRRWKQMLMAEAVGRYDMSGSILKAKRRTQGDIEPLWTAAVNRSKSFLVVRRGILYATPWAPGQVVEAMAIQFGKRHLLPSTSNTSVMFEVPLTMSDDEQEAVIAA